MNKVVALEVVAIADGEVVHTMPLSTPLDDESRALERKLSGMLMRVDTERFFVREVYEDVPVGGSG